MIKARRVSGMQKMDPESGSRNAASARQTGARFGPSSDLFRHDLAALRPHWRVRG